MVFFEYLNLSSLRGWAKNSLGGRWSIYIFPNLLPSCVTEQLIDFLPKSFAAAIECLLDRRVLWQNLSYLNTHTSIFVPLQSFVLLMTNDQLDNFFGHCGSRGPYPRGEPGIGK